MQPSEMEDLIQRHISAEAAGDVDGAVAVYTPDIVHDVVGWPTGPNAGIDAARGFYSFLVQNIKTETMKPTHKYYGQDFAVIEHTWEGTVPGEFLGVPGKGKHIAFRMLHVWEFKDQKISRENVWLDGDAIIHQLTSDD